MIISGDPCNVRTCGVMQQRRICSKSNLLQISSWILFISTTRGKKTEKKLEKEPTTSATNGLCRFWDWSSKHVNSFLDMEEIYNMNKDGASGGSTCWKKLQMIGPKQAAEGAAHGSAERQDCSASQRWQTCWAVYCASSVSCAFSIFFQLLAPVWVEVQKIAHMWMGCYACCLRNLAGNSPRLSSLSDQQATFLQQDSETKTVKSLTRSKRTKQFSWT